MCKIRLRHLLEGRVFFGGGQVKRHTPNPQEIQGLSSNNYLGVDRLPLALWLLCDGLWSVVSMCKFVLCL